MAREVIRSDRTLIDELLAVPVRPRARKWPPPITDWGLAKWWRLRGIVLRYGRIVRAAFAVVAAESERSSSGGCSSAQAGSAPKGSLPPAALPPSQHGTANAECTEDGPRVWRVMITD